MRDRMLHSGSVRVVITACLLLSALDIMRFLPPLSRVKTNMTFRKEQRTLCFIATKTDTAVAIATGPSFPATQMQRLDRVPTLSWTPDSRTFKDFFKHHLFYIKHLSNSHASICSVMKDLTVLNISLTLNLYIKNFRVIMFWMCRFHKFRPFWAVVFK